ncbi:MULTISPECIES: hypothetical protein [Olivibacter]|uniref:DUF1828 domain-containing protein n=1 Tax=Olivibacter jilunii TaxID=985016 RepID=A0ABW6B6T5_9SPHI
MDNAQIIEQIKSSFCNLTSFKVRQNALEIITAYSTINNKFVSVFVTYTNQKIVITDSGWIDQNYYETPVNDESEDIIGRIIGLFKASYSVKSTLDKSGREFYYKTCENIEQIPSCVFDLANFIVGVVNGFCMRYKDEKEERERETFKTDANDFLKLNYDNMVKLRAPLDDFKGIKFNAIINKGPNLFIITYVTGSSSTYFENDLRKAIVNFEIAQKSKYKDLIKEKITIINDLSEGYSMKRSANIFELLKEKTTRKPIKWTEKERILEII